MPWRHYCRAPGSRRRTEGLEQGDEAECSLAGAPAESRLAAAASVRVAAAIARTGRGATSLAALAERRARPARRISPSSRIVAGVRRLMPVSRGGDDLHDSLHPSGPGGRGEFEERGCSHRRPQARFAARLRRAARPRHGADRSSGDRGRRIPSRQPARRRANRSSLATRRIARTLVEQREATSRRCPRAGALAWGRRFLVERESATTALPRRQSAFSSARTRAALRAIADTAWAASFALVRDPAVACGETLGSTR